MRLIPKPIEGSMHFNDITFAQPLWLLALILVPIGWLWNYYWSKLSSSNLNSLSKFIDEKLLPHLLVSKNSKSEKSKMGYIYVAFTICVVLALANPRWGYKEFDAYQPTASMVILLDLSMSMNATDVSPSRIVRARQNIEDLLNLSHGIKIGLIGFARYPHLISPITDDIQTIRTFLPALDTDLSDLQGSSLAASLQMANELLAAEPGDKKSILLVSDGNIISGDYSKELSMLQDKNIQVHVIGVGTDTGAPYKNKHGALHKVQGKVITSKLNAVDLKDIAKHGHGIYTEATYNDFGLQTILHKAENTSHSAQLTEGKVRQWNDRYYLFLIPAAVIFLYLMRRRALYTLLISVIGSSMFSFDVDAFTVRELFLNSEQQGQEYYINGDFKHAADHFRDAYHKGVAFYRDGQFSQAEEQFNKVQRSAIKTSAMYNAGNAQMQQKKWQDAITSYEDVLSMEPDNTAAKHNLEIARKMLAEQNKQDQNDKNCECKDQKSKQNKQAKNAAAQNDKDNAKNKSGKQEQAATENKSSVENKQDSDSTQDNQTKHGEHSKQDIPSKEAKKNKQDSQNIPGMQQDISKSSTDEAHIEHMLNRVDSDIKVFLKNKIYIEDVLSEQ